MQYFSQNIIRGLFVMALFFAVAMPAHAARVMTSGCELQAGSPGTAIDNMEWDTSGGAVEQISTTVKRSGLASCRVFKTGSGGSGFFEQPFTATLSDATYYGRFYINISSGPSVTTDIAQYMSGVSTEQSLWLTPSRTLELRSSDETTVIATYNTPLKVGKWYRVEWMYNSTGSNSAQVLVNGGSVMSASGFAGGQIDRLSLGLAIDGPAATGDLYFDDVGVNDNSGGLQNTWLGSGAIFHMQPDGDGSSSGSGSSNDCNSGANWDEMEEVTPDNDTSYCQLDSGGKVVRLTVESPASAGLMPADIVKYVAVGARVRAESNSTIRWKTGLRSSDSDNMTYTSATQIVHSTVSYHTNGANPPKRNSYQSYVQPVTGVAWTHTGTRSLDTTEIGVETGTGVSMRVTAIWLQVEVDRSGFLEPTGLVYESGTNTGLYMTSASRGQEKGANNPSSTGLGLGADFFVVTNKICLGSNPANCLTDWWRTLPASTCKLDTRKVYGPPTTFGTILTTQTCMQRLSIPARQAGWTATGVDRCSGGTCGAGDRSSCVYTKMTCAGSVYDTTPPLQTIQTHTAAIDGTLTYTPQCMDGVDNDAGGGTDFPADVDCTSFGDNSE